MFERGCPEEPVSHLLAFVIVPGVGDRMHLSNPMLETNPDGSSGWIVEKVQLYTTTACWGATNERATLCNGAISTLRVINAARSPNATVYVPLKFHIDTEYEKIQIFRSGTFWVFTFSWMTFLFADNFLCPFLH